MCFIILGIVYLVIVLLYKFAGMIGLMLWYLDMGAFTKLIIAAGVTALYYIVFETLTGSTIGKYITNTRVVDEFGQKPTAKAVLIRTVCRLMPIEVFTFIGEGNVGLHDSASKTFVVDMHKYNHSLRAKRAYEKMSVSENDFRPFNN
jgi:uncharacterized RDD family membrane protein YckC